MRAGMPLVVYLIPTYDHAADKFPPGFTMPINMTELGQTTTEPAGLVPPMDTRSRCQLPGVSATARNMESSWVCIDFEKERNCFTTLAMPDKRVPGWE
jgi:hypothetical protein